MNTHLTAAEFVDKTIPRGMRDGVEIHRAALSSGMNTRLYPRQVLEVFSPDGEKTTAFTHGLPQASTLSGVTFTQDLRMARGLLKKAGVPTPAGATFSVGYSKKAALRYGDKLGYPVVVKPEIGDGTIDVVRGITSRGELSRAIDTLLTPPEQRPDSTQASYGITELRKPGMKDGKVTVPPGYRFFVEEEAPGTYFRILVLDGKPLDVVRCSGGPWGGQGTRVSPPELWPAEAIEGATAAARALPGLAVLSIDVVVPEAGSGETNPTSRSEPVVVDVSERPWLEVQQRIAPELAQQLAGEILRFGLGGEDLQPPRNAAIEAQVKFLGVVAPSAFMESLQHAASAWRANAQLITTDETLGRVTAVVQGYPGDIAELVEVVLDRGAQGQVAMRADVVQQ